MNDENDDSTFPNDFEPEKSDLELGEYTMVTAEDIAENTEDSIITNN